MLPETGQSLEGEEIHVFEKFGFRRNPPSLLQGETNGVGAYFSKKKTVILPHPARASRNARFATIRRVQSAWWPPMQNAQALR
jgi:hypothetical protein